jgi:hypothetical protein
MADPLRVRTTPPCRAVALGLQDFDGRSWPGWRHHATLVSVAHRFLTLEQLRGPKQLASGLTLWQLLRGVAGAGWVLGRCLPGL